MVERIKESGSILDKKQIINSFLSFKKEFDQKIKNCSTINKDIPKPNENFINIYKANNDENMEKIKINNFSTNQMTNIEIQQKSKPLKISDLDFFNNSELLLSNIDEMINKDNVLNSQTLVKVPTSDSLEDIQNENDQNYEMNESNRSRSFSPNSTAVNFGRSERLKSIDEKDESREEDNVSKSSKKLIEDYHIITEEEYVKKKSNKIIPQKENSIKKNSDKKKCDNNLSDIGDKIFSEKNKGKEKTKEMKLIPKFTFLDYKEFKNKSLHSQNSKIKETNDLKPYIAKTENSLSVNSIPNNSSFYKQKYFFSF